MGDKVNLKETLDKLNLSNEECNKFEKAFKDPEFIKLFEEYAKEVSDPKVKGETDIYLRQLEREGQGEQVYGAGSELIVPKESFAVKITGNAADGKIFVNVCTNEKVEKAETVKCKGGMTWEMPLMLGPQKIGEDSRGQPCKIYDCCVHPATVETAKTNFRIMQALIEMVCDKIRETSKLNIGKQWKIMKTKYRKCESAPQPGVLLYKKSDNQPVDDTSKENSQDTNKQIEPIEPNKQNNNNVNPRSGFSFPTPPKKVVTPPHQLVHVQHADMSNTWMDKRALEETSNLPASLLLRVELKGVVSIAEIVLDISPKFVKLEVEERYNLEYVIPYEVVVDKCGAKFDKSSSNLELRMPVAPVAKPPPQNRFQPDTAENPQNQNSLVQEISNDSENLDLSDDLKQEEEEEQQFQQQQVLQENNDNIQQQQSPGGQQDNEEKLSENQIKWQQLHQQKIREEEEKDSLVENEATNQQQQEVNKLKHTENQQNMQQERVHTEPQKANNTLDDLETAKNCCFQLRPSLMEIDELD